MFGGVRSASIVVLGGVRLRVSVRMRGGHRAPDVDASVVIAQYLLHGKMINGMEKL